MTPLGSAAGSPRECGSTAGWPLARGSATGWSRGGEGRGGGGDEKVREREWDMAAWLLPLSATTVAERRGGEALAATRR